MTSQHRMLTAATVLWTVLTGGCAVPHSSRVPAGGYAAISAGGGAARVRGGCRDCTQTERVSPVPSAQVTVGYGWRERDRPALAYLTAPLITPVSIGRNAPDDGAEAVEHVAFSLVGGASIGGYLELGGDGQTSASGVGAMLDVVSVIGAVGESFDEDGLEHPAAQVYAMAGGRVGDAWVDVGLRGGVITEGAVGGGAFAAARWARDGYRIGVWFDAAGATDVDLEIDEGSMVIPVVATAGVMLESW